MYLNSWQLKYLWNKFKTIIIFFDYIYSNMDIVISKSDNKHKKFKAIIDGKKTVHFGSSAHSDFRQHQDDQRKQSYIARHKKNEDWTKYGVETAGFMNKKLLWNKKTLKDSVDDLNKKYKDINFKYKK